MPKSGASHPTRPLIFFAINPDFIRAGESPPSRPLIFFAINPILIRPGKASYPSSIFIGVL